MLHVFVAEKERWMMLMMMIVMRWLAMMIIIIVVGLIKDFKSN